MSCHADGRGGHWIAGRARDHAGRLAAIARREGAPPADALDVVQDAFAVLLYRARKELERCMAG